MLGVQVMRRVGFILRAASKFVSGVALAAAIMVGAALTSQSAHAITINYALSSAGASFVSASSEIGAGNATQMQNNLLLPNGSKVDWFGDGDTRFTFGANDPNGTIEISLGQIRQITDIGTTFTVRSDRNVTGPITIQVSLNGTTWTSWGAATVGSATSIGPTTDEVSIVNPLQSVEYIMIGYGPTGDPYSGFGGSAVGSIFADVDAVPLPATWTMLIVGFAGLGFFAHRAKSKAAGAFAAG
jgi:hypothetical protein